MRPNSHDDAAPIQDERVAKDVRFLIQGLHQLAQEEVSPDFHGTVMTKARALPRPRPKLVDRIEERLTVWAPVLALGLVLSLGVHIWQGFRTPEPRASRVPQAVKTALSAQDAAGALSTYRLQVEMLHADALGRVVATRPARGMPLTGVGFAPHAMRTLRVRMGTWYAETLAALQGGAIEAAVPRLDLLTQALRRVQAPPPLSQYLREMQALLQRRPHESKTVAQFVALFEPLYVDAYANDATAAEVLWFRAGAWLENLALAAAMGAATVGQQVPAVHTWQQTLRQLNAPPEALEALEQLRTLMMRQELAASDFKAISTVVQDLQTRLSE